MIPLFIPHTNRPDLTAKAIRSVWGVKGVEVIVIDNSDGGELPVEAQTVYTPPVPLTFAQTHNVMLRKAIGEKNIRLATAHVDHPLYLWSHNDMEASPGVVSDLVQFALNLNHLGRKWGTVFTNYDSLAALNTEAVRAVGGWDTMLSWYGSDCDAYRRLRLAGYPSMESNLPVKHTPSQTLNSDPFIKFKVDMEIPFRSNYYAAKWGGPPGHESFDKPFNGRFQ